MKVKKMRKALSLFLGAVLLLGLMPAYSSALEPSGEWYEIGTAAQLVELSRSMAYFKDGTIPVNAKIRLTSDIDMQGVEGYRPIGDNSGSNGYFVGELDGQGHTVSNLSITYDPGWSQDLKDPEASLYVGFFGYISSGARIHDLGLVNVEYSSPSGNVGGLAGMNNGGVIERCFVTGAVSGAGYTGGMVGRMRYGSVLRNCYAYVDVYGSSEVGGLVGAMLTGVSDGMTVESCIYAGKVSALGGPAGGIAGSVSGGPASNGIQNCFVAGFSVSGVSAGAFCASESYGSLTIKGCAVWDETAVNGARTALPAGVGQISRDAFGKGETYSGFDFANIWIMTDDANGSYPQLRGFSSQPAAVWLVEQEEENDRTGYAPPSGGGAQPGSVSFLFDSFSQPAGQFAARFNWVTSTAVQTTRLYYAKADDFAATGRYSKRIDGASDTVDLSKNAVYNGTDNISLAPVQSHKAETLTLEPGTRYVWCVGDGDRNVSAQGSFTTPSEDADTFSFIWITDAQTNGSSYQGTLDRYTRYAKRAVDTAMADFPDAAFILTTGDHVNQVFDTWQWDAFFEANREVFAKTPLYLAAGNHEYDGYPTYTGDSGSIDVTLSGMAGRYNPPKNGAAYYGAGADGAEPLAEGLGRARLKNSNYYFIYGDTLFMVLENVSGDEAIAEQTAWMKSVVKNNPTRWRVANLHVSLFPGWRSQPSSFREWTDAMDECGVDLVLMGHEHVYLRTKLIDGGSPIANQESFGSGTTYITNSPATNAMEYVYYDRSYTNVWADGFGSSYGAITVSPEGIWITAKGYRGEELTPTEVEAGALITDTPRDYDLSGWEYPPAASPEAKAPILSVAVGGVAKEDQVLLALPQPRGATAAYTWQISGNGVDGWTDIPGSSGVDYTVGKEDVGRYLRVIASGKGDFCETVASAATERVKPLRAGGSNEPGYTLDLSGIADGGLPAGWYTDNAAQVYVTDAPDGARAVAVDGAGVFTAGFGFGAQREVFTVSYSIYVETMGKYPVSESTYYASKMAFLDADGNQVSMNQAMTWGDCGGEFYWTGPGGIMGSKLYRDTDGDLVFMDDRESGRWIEFVYSFDFTAGTYTITCDKAPVYTSAAHVNEVFAIPPASSELVGVRFTNGTGANSENRFYYKDIVVGDGGASAPDTPGIREGVWTITDMGAGGHFPVVGEGPDGLLVAGGDLAGVYISDNDGQTWKNAGSAQGLTGMHVSALGFDPSDPHVFYVGTEGGLYRTEDRGGSFVKVVGGGYWTAVAVSGDGKTVYAACSEHYDSFTNGIYVSKDGGDTFEKRAMQLDKLRINKLLVPQGSENAVLALSQADSFMFNYNEDWEPFSDVLEQVFLSVDGAARWTQVNAGEAFLNEGILDFCLDALDPGVLYLSRTAGHINWAMPGDSEGDGLYAVRWADNILLAVEEGVAGLISASESEGKTLLRVINAWGAEKSELIHDNAAEIGNGGWTHTQYDFSFPFVRPQWGLVDTPLAYCKGIVQSLADADTYYLCGPQWVFRSEDGMETVEQIFSDFVSGDETDPYNSFWRGRGISNAVPHTIAISPANPNVVYAGYADLGFWRSLDLGKSWQLSNDPHFSNEWGGAGGGCLAIAPDPTRENVVWAAFGAETFDMRVLKSVDYGKTWTTTDHNGLPELTVYTVDWEEATAFGGRILSISVDKTSPEDNRALYLTCSDNDYTGDVLCYKVYKSTDDGATWTALEALPGGVYFTVEVDPLDGNIVYAGGSAGLYRSSDAGVSWVRIDGGSNPKMDGKDRGDDDNSTDGVVKIAVSPSDPGVVYVACRGANGGVYKSADRGLTYKKVLEDACIASTAVHPEDPDIVFATASSVTRSGGDDPYGFVRLSLDGGRTWNEHMEGLAYPVAGAISVNPLRPEAVFIGAPGNAFQMRLFNYSKPVSSITRVSVTTPTLVEKLAANLLITAEGENLDGKKLTAYFSVDGELLYPTDISSGKVMMKISQAPAAGSMCKVVVISDDGAQNECDITLAEYKPVELWNPAVNPGPDSGNLLITFGDIIGPATGGKITVAVNGKSVAWKPDGDRSIEIDIPFDESSGITVVVKDIKYPILFPSYKFTFTILVP